MRKLLVVMITLSMLLGLAACGGSASGSGSGKQEKEVIRIGIVQFVQHSALDQATQGFKDALAAAGYVEGQNVVFDYQDASGEQANAVTIVNQFVADGVDLIFANATPAAEAALNVTKDIPIIITSVTDPASSDLVDSNEKPGGNLTGTSDMTPCAQQIELLKEIFPDAKNIAIMFNSAEDNSRIQADLAEKACDEIGLGYTEATVSDLNNLQSIVESLVGKVDAIYIPTDNMMANGMATVSMICTNAGIGIICGEANMVNNGALATIGINYYNLGMISGEMAKDVIEGADTATMPIRYLALEDCEKTLNLTAAKALGITFSESVLEGANTVE